MVLDKKKRREKLMNKVGKLVPTPSNAEQRTNKINELWAVTTFFNPSHFKTKLINYRRFRKESRKQGLNLICVELSYDGSYELNETDAETVIQLESQCVLWQKERLLNLALEKLPPQCTKVCWIDADLVFTNPQWVYQTSCLLDHFPMIQPYEKGHRLPKNAVNNKNLNRFAKPDNEVTGIVYHYKLKKKYNRDKHCGYVWAIRRKIIDKVKFYDKNIIGGGDRIMCRAAFYKQLASHHRPNQPTCPFTIPHARNIEYYMNRLHQMVGGRVFFTPGRVYHLWHGNAKNRQYSARHKILKKFNYHPLQDIKHAPNGSWMWATEKKGLRQAIKEYFQGRKED